MVQDESRAGGQWRLEFVRAQPQAWPPRPGPSASRVVYGWLRIWLRLVGKLRFDKNKHFPEPGLWLVLDEAKAGGQLRLRFDGK